MCYLSTGVRFSNNHHTTLATLPHAAAMITVFQEFQLPAIICERFKSLGNGPLNPLKFFMKIVDVELYKL